MKPSCQSTMSTRAVFQGLLLLWFLCLPLLAQSNTADDYATRFGKAQALTRQGDDDAASKIYEALIKQAPGKPQAYNNLAAIKARHGEYKEAQALLERALRSDPVYATVYENLSAIYVEMARDSYGKALRLDTPPQPVALRLLDKPKAASIQVATAPAVNPPAEVKAPAVADKPAKPEAPVAKSTASTQSSPQVIAANTAGPAPASTAVTPPAGLAQTKTPPSAAQTATVAEVVASQATPTAETPSLMPGIEIQNEETPASTEVDKDKVITSLQGWAAAWSAKSVDLYLEFYASDYAPPGMTHTQWAAQRRARLQAPKWIQVTLNDFAVDAVKDDLVRVRLDQVYKADNYQDRSRKEFQLRRTPDGWRIVEEKTIAMSH
ncbi:MAG: tetratricopeptide repeat protein [Gammaproteobacteria bacterium]|nr:tetratricopeptide repeat protein [Gammaproteobacteria bacterium]